ncbi:MAG TPA: tRNA (adenosine(37)-N6)-dimethylallyltransferase MiaA [Acidimicrobiia bacterium]
MIASGPARQPLHLAIVGPTAAGKSELALAVARRAGDCEIVSLDAMQVYREMDVGTAKPSAAERTEIVHHLIDAIDPGTEWSVALAQREARAAVHDIEARGRRAVLVGGSGLYVQAVVDDLTLPVQDLALRAELEASTSEPGGLAAAWAELRAADPDAAARIDEHNQRRIVRALEVVRSTGRPFSEFGSGVFEARAALDAEFVGVWRSRTELTARISQRIDTMRAGGLEAEVARLDGRLSRSAVQAIGYKELVQARRGELTVDVAFDLAERRTRSFARRQRMWFRRDPRVRWIRPDGGNVSAAADAVLACWRPECVLR